MTALKEHTEQMPKEGHRPIVRTLLKDKKRKEIRCPMFMEEDFSVAVWKGRNSLKQYKV